MDIVFSNHATKRLRERFDGVRVKEIKQFYRDERCEIIRLRGSRRVIIIPELNMRLKVELVSHKDGVSGMIYLITTITVIDKGDTEPQYSPKKKARANAKKERKVKEFISGDGRYHSKKVDNDKFHMKKRVKQNKRRRR